MASSINNNVNLGGTQEIEGYKKFLRRIGVSAKIPYTETPSETEDYGLKFVDSNKTLWAFFQSVLYASGTNRIEMGIKGKTGKNSSMYVQENEAGAVTYSYGQQIGTNWIKIPRGAGNAILYCWGNATLKTGDTVTFPTAFNTTPVVQLTMLSGTAYGFPAYTSAVTSTNFTARRNDSNDVPCMWFAVGSANL